MSVASEQNRQRPYKEVSETVLPLQRLLRPSPWRISFRIPIFLTDWLRERRGWIKASRARLALRVYSMGV
jgi:hypothetical protein